MLKRRIKRQYDFLDLPYDSSIEDVLIRQKIIIKIIRANTITTGNTQRQKIEKVVRATEKIVAYIEQNGILSNSQPMFNPTRESLLWQTLFFLGITAVGVITFLSLL